MRKVTMSTTVPVDVDADVHSIRFGFANDGEKLSWIQIEFNGPLSGGEKKIQLNAGDPSFDTVLGNLDLGGVVDRLLSDKLPGATVTVLDEKPPKEEKDK